MDVPSLISELQFRGLDQEKVDSALRCLVHVYTVQDVGSPDAAGVLAEDIVSTYPLDVVQAASELFLDTTMTQGRETFRVKWGFEFAATQVEEQLWDHGSRWWEGFLRQLNERYLGFVMPTSDDGARVIVNWKLSKDLKWFSVEVPRHGWNILRFVDDLTAVALKLDLAYEYRELGSEGILGRRVILHRRAYEALKERRVQPPEDIRLLIRLWRFFSEYDVDSTDFVALMKDCGLTLDDIQGQIAQFFASDLTSKYREGQYPPYFINAKKKKEFQEAVKDLLRPMDKWLTGKKAIEAPAQGQGQPLQNSTQIDS